MESLSTNQIIILVLVLFLSPIYFIATSSEKKGDIYCSKGLEVKGANHYGTNDVGISYAKDGARHIYKLKKGEVCSFKRNE